MNNFGAKEILLGAFLGCFFLNFSLVKSFEIKVLDDIESVLKTNKMHVSLNPGEFQAVYKDNIIFSLDVPKIRVKNWEFDFEADMKNIRGFKKDKKGFVTTFGVQLNLIFFNASQEDLKKSLETLNLYISCLVVDNKGVTVPKCFVKKLALESLSVASNKLSNEITGSASLGENFLRESKNLNCVSTDFSISGTFKSVMNKMQNSKLGALAESKFLLVVLFLLLFFSLYFFIPRKKEEVGFRFVVGIFLLSLGLIFLIKICLIKSYWPFDKMNNPEQKSRVVEK